MVFNPAGNSTSSKRTHPENTEEPTISTVPGMLTSRNWEQPEKKLPGRYVAAPVPVTLPMLVYEAGKTVCTVNSIGIDTSVMAGQLAKGLYLLSRDMFVTLPGITTRSSPLHPANALSPTSVTPSGISISASPVHPEKTELEMRDKPGGNLTLDRREQEENALSPISTTPAGMSAFAKFVQLLKASFPMDFNPSGMWTVSSTTHPLNEDCSMARTAAGNSTTCNFEQPEKACNWTISTVAGMDTSHRAVHPLNIPAQTDVAPGETAAFTMFV